MIYHGTVADRDPQHLTSDTRAAFNRLGRFAASQGLPFSPVETYRSCERQTELFAQGRETPGDKVTHVNSCHSWHTWARAFDLQDIGIPALMVLGAEWERMGGRHGGSWGDFVHFEWHPGIELSDWCPGSAGSAQACVNLQTAMRAGVSSGGAKQAIIGAAIVTLGYAGYRLYVLQKQGRRPTLRTLWT